MGQVVPFIARVRDSGDWTATERARLQDLADRLAAGGVTVDVVFGATDEGDPWCVVADEDGDVLIHVARIGGVFIVHSAVDDAVSEDRDLHAALRDRLDITEEAIAPRSADVLPFGLTARQGQTFLALVIATAFFYETSGVGGEAQAAETPRVLLPADDPPQPVTDAETPVQERELAAQGATLRDPDPTPSAQEVVAVGPGESAKVTMEGPTLSAPAGPTAPLEATEVVLASGGTDAPIATVIRGTDGDDLLVGTTADERIQGGDGDDTLIGGGGYDTLEGGAGDDRIELTATVVAVGGQGADTFVIAAPTHMSRGDTLLGTVVDFSRLDGDRFVTTNGGPVRVLPTRPGADDKTPAQDPPNGSTNGHTDTSSEGPTAQDPPTLAPPTLGPSTDSTNTALTSQGGFFGPTLVNPSLNRVEVDLDGDGVADGYVLVGQDAMITLTGQSLPAGDLFG